MPVNNPVTINVQISGRVQGVGYRNWTVTQAQNRHIIGWVRNRTDGSVEAVFSGDKDSVDDMLLACYKGPAFANVTNIRTKTGEYNGSKTFEEHPTK